MKIETKHQIGEVVWIVKYYNGKWTITPNNVIVGFVAEVIGTDTPTIRYIFDFTGYDVADDKVFKTKKEAQAECDKLNGMKNEI